MNPTHIYDLQAQRIDGSNLSMADLRGKVLLIVNTASACGFTPQFEGLQQLHANYAEKGLVILGFPCNQFGAQDPGSHEQIQAFCQGQFDVQFAMMAKIEVNSAQAHPVYQWLKQQAPGLLGSEAIKWNFTKFLVSRDGQQVTRYGSMDKPSALVRDIEDALGAAA
jgi:glutathione peroxidase